MQPEAQERLLRSVSEFNAWKTDIDEEIDLEEVDLCGKTIAGANMTGVSLKRARLLETRFDSVVFDETVLFKVDARQAVFNKCRFKDVFGSEINLSGARLWQCRLEGGTLARANLTDARLDHSLLDHVKLEDTVMTGASLLGALVVNCLLPRGTTLDGVTQRKTGTTHLDFYWISESGDEYAIGPLLEGQPYAQSLRRYRRKEPEVIRQFARMVAGIVKTHHRLSACDTIVPVPPRAPAAAEYANALLTGDVCRQNNLRDGTNWLVRHKAVVAAGDIEKHFDSLAVTAASVEGRSILLLDDYVASGATLEACRQLLLTAGARQVLSLLLARDPLKPLLP